MEALNNLTRQAKEGAVRLLTWTIIKLAKLTMVRYRPGVVGITGSVGKTSTKRAIEAVLGGERHVRASKGNLNADIGIALTVLGDWTSEEIALVSHDTPAHTAQLKKIKFWLKVIAKSSWQLIRHIEYPEFLILEYGIEKPGDMRRYLSIARPNVSVITAIGDIPVHVEAFSGRDELAREKGRLVEFLPAAGFAILNCDDETVLAMGDRTRANIITYGFAKEADVRIGGFDYRIHDERPMGITFKLEYGGTSIPARIDEVFGKSQAYAGAAAAAVGLVFGLNLVRITEALASYHPAPGRMQLMQGIKETRIVNDAYNASVLSMNEAFDVVKHLPGKRKIAVLGDMLEIGKYSIEAHEALGERAAKIFDVLITVGSRAKFIARAAEKAGMQRKNIESYDTAEEGARAAQDIIKKGDLILVKASHSIHLEKVVEEIKLPEALLGA